MKLPRSRIIRVEFEMVLDCDATLDEIEEYVNYEIAQRGGCNVDNPLLSRGVSVPDDPVLTDTGMHLHEEAVDIRQLEDGWGWRRKRRRSSEPYTGPTVDEQVAAAKAKAAAP
ncbi:MAG: hypothetical protein KF723_22350 [Rhizobiaceae bacterium]|nr:hypothetical protein [Rhizobiaceae bacterium]